MGKHRHTPRDNQPPPIADPVSRNLGSEYWSVDDCAWSTLRPGLPDDLIDLLAPPIVVGAVPVIGIARPPVATLARPPAAAGRPATPACSAATPARSAGPGPSGGSGRPAAPVLPKISVKSTGPTRPPGRHRRSGPVG